LDSRWCAKTREFHYICLVVKINIYNLQVSERCSNSATILLKSSIKGHIPTQISNVLETKQTAFGDGCGIILMAHTSNGFRLAGTALGKRGVPAEKVGEDAATMLLNNIQHEECVDEHLQDQVKTRIKTKKYGNIFKLCKIQNCLGPGFLG
jgi:RNA 3'-terminal phosphate cyclase